MAIPGESKLKFQSTVNPDFTNETYLEDVAKTSHACKQPQTQAQHEAVSITKEVHCALEPENLQLPPTTGR